MAAIRKKLVAVGSKESGKTPMLHAFKGNALFIDYFPSMFMNCVEDVEVDGKLVELALWDVVGSSTAWVTFDSHILLTTIMYIMHWVEHTCMHLSIVPLGDDNVYRLRPLNYPDTDVIVICFSCDSHDSLEEVPEKWAPELRHFCPNGNDICCR